MLHKNPNLHYYFFAIKIINLSNFFPDRLQNLNVKELNLAVQNKEFSSANKVALILAS